MSDPDNQTGIPNACRLKICFVGNTNNYPFLIASAMRNMGHDVTVLLDRPETLHRPNGRYEGFDLDSTDWVRDISADVTPDGWILSRSDALKRAALSRYDLLVLNGLGLALAGGRGVRSFAMLTGSDLTHLANWASLRILWRSLTPSVGLVRRALACVLHGRTVYRQRSAIRSSFGVSYFVRGVVPEADRVLDSMGVGAERRTSFMLSDVGHISPAPMPARTASSPLLRVFNVARLNWRQPKPAHLSELDMKGTDILLAGFALFLSRTKSDAQLVLVRKGVDVEATEREVRRLGVAQNIVWLPEMSQAAVFEQYAMADVVTEQLSTSYVGMGGLDAMAAARPVIANTRPDVPAKELLADSPVMHATTPEDVCRHLERLAHSRDSAVVLGERSRRYVEERHSPEATAKRILARFFAARDGAPETR